MVRQLGFARLLSRNEKSRRADALEGAATRRLTSIRPLCRGLIGPSELPSNLSSDVFVYLSRERLV